jgi:two-component system, NarL family, invasion response regulator UvrY
MTTVALADDHHLIRNALVELINNFENFEVIFDVADGKKFVDQLKTQASPDIALIDINMPIMDGFQTAEYLTKHHPEIKILALSVEDNEESIIKMLRLGAVGYLLKDTDTYLFKTALEEIANKGYYHSELVSSTLLKSINGANTTVVKQNLGFQSRELEFLELACSEYTYKEIADKMCLSPRTIDGYRESLFEKLNIKSRVGLVLYAIKNGLIMI